MEACCAQACPGLFLTFKGVDSMKKILVACVLFGISLGFPSAWAVQFNFTPELTVSEEYTDNVFLTSDDDNKIEDFITTTGLSLTMEALWRTAGLELNYSPSYHQYCDNEELDYTRHEAFLSFYKDLSKVVRLELTDTFLETEDPRDESEGIEGIEGEDLLIGPVIEVDPTRRDRTRHRTNVAQLRLTHRLAANSSYYIGVVHSALRDVDPPPGEILDDFNATQPIFGIEYWFTPKWGFLLDASVSNRDFKEREDRKEYFGLFRLQRNFERHLTAFLEYRHTALEFEEPDGQSDYHIYSPAIGFEYQPGKYTAIDVSAGYYFQDFEEDAREDESGFSLHASIAHSWPFRTGYIRIIGLSGYEIDDTGAEELGLNIYYMARTEAGVNFTNRLSGNLFASYRIDEYPNETPDRTDNTFDAGAGLEYQPLKWMNFRLEYEYTNVTSDIDTEEYAENSIILTMTLVPSSPFRF